MERVKNEIRELHLLLEISQSINKSRNVKEVMMSILDMLTLHLGLERGTVTLLNRDKGKIYIEAASGLSNEQMARGKYKVGEGIIGKVVESGQAVIIPRIADEPGFLDKTQARQSMNPKSISFLCAPIMHDKEVIGTLSVDKHYDEQDNMKDDLRLITIICNMVAAALRARQEELEELARLQAENDRLQGQLEQRFKPANMIGGAQIMRDVYALIYRVAPTISTVLITGESGVGKEMVANALHFNSKRANKPLIKVNCSALPDSLLESELFGHEKGAFTGADKLRKGRFELAEGGTIFLDEIGELPMSTQVKLLRFLQEREIERLGGSQTIKIDARVITATNRNLEEEVKKGNFREDLFYRLNVFPVHIPPLRERKSDIPVLADHFIEKYNKLNGLTVKRISTPAIDLIMSYHWPGNVRELENCIERASILSNDGVIHAYHLPPTLQAPVNDKDVTKGPLQSILNKLEKELIQDTLKLTRGNLAQAADHLGITERMIGTRITKYNINPKRFKTKSLKSNDEDE